MGQSDALVVIDYQNIHLTGHELWCVPGSPAHECLISPLHFANQVVRVRNLVKRLNAEKSGGEYIEARLAGVHAFRGLPSNEYASSQYRRSLAQQSEWTRDERVSVQYRPLKYYRENGRRRAQEKGVDVMVALDVVASATEGDFGVVILASHDTDLEPALEMAGRVSGASIETAGWMNCKRLKAGRQQLWHTALNDEGFVASRDLREY